MGQRVPVAFTVAHEIAQRIGRHNTLTQSIAAEIIDGLFEDGRLSIRLHSSGLDDRAQELPAEAEEAWREFMVDPGLHAAVEIVQQWVVRLGLDNGLVVGMSAAQMLLRDEWERA